MQEVKERCLVTRDSEGRVWEWVAAPPQHAGYWCDACQRQHRVVLARAMEAQLCPTCWRQQHGRMSRWER